jgi:hypothetical protein
MSTTTPAGFNRTIPLSRAAEPKIRDALAAGRLGAFRRAWLRSLSKPRRRAERRLPAKTWLALWSVNTTELTDRERPLATALEAITPLKATKKPGRRPGKSSRPAPQSLDQALTEWSSAITGRSASWETLAVAEVLFRVGEHLKAETFATCLAVLARGFGRSSQANLSPAAAGEPSVGKMAPSDCEVPWVTGLLLSPLNGAARLQRSGLLALQQLLRESTDPHGLPTGAACRQLPDILRTFARSTAWARIFHQPLWNDFHPHLQRLVEAAVLLQVPPQPGSAVAATDVPPQPSAGLAPVLRQLLDDDSGDHSVRLEKLLKKVQKPITKVRVPKRWRPAPDTPADPETARSESHTTSSDSAVAEPPTTKDSAPAHTTCESLLSKSPSASWQSDEGRLALLRSSSDPDADMVLVDWHSGAVHLQIYAAGTLLFSGQWHWSARLDDDPAAGPAAWRCSCWFDDAECVFLELEADCGSGLRGVRQIMLATRERFLMLTDSVTSGNAEPRLQLTTALPFAEGTSIEPDPVTRELRLTRGPVHVRLLPAWLEDDRIQHTFGQCQAHDGQLESSAIAAGGATLPLVLDWHPDRSSEPADWTKLTVTEARRYNGTHEAAGFRIRIGDFQLLVYRSLIAGRDSRAVMGLHTWDETVYTRVPGRGSAMEALVSVETPE